MKPMRPENRALFRAGQRAFEPTSTDRARMDRALGVALGGGVLTGTSVATAATAGASAEAATVVAGASTMTVAATGSMTAGVAKVAVASALTKWAIVAALLIAGSAAAVRLRSPDALPVAKSTSNAARNVTPPEVRRQAPAPLTPTITPSSRAVSPAPLPLSSSAGQPAPPVTPAPAPVERTAEPSVSVGEEARLLRDADDAIRRGELPLAGRLLEQYEWRFPRGILTEERDAEHALLVCASGGAASSHEASRQFSASHPDSPLVARVRAACP